MKWLKTKRVSTFAREPYEGYPSWVVLGADRDEDPAVFARLARELNSLTGTVFLFPSENDADLYLRFFSRSGEMSFSSACTLAAYLGLEGEDMLTLTEPITIVRQKTKTGIQHLELRVKEQKVNRVTASLPIPQFISTPVDLKKISYFLGVAPADILRSNYSVGVVSLSGCTDIIVPLSSCELLNSTTPDFGKMKLYCETYQLTGIVLFCPEREGRESTAHMRYFAPAIGIDEDPVAGAACAALGSYMLQNKIVRRGEMLTRIIINHGRAVDRPGTTYVHVHTHKNSIIKVTVGGQGMVTFTGTVLSV
jgi:PhzF family phenazine biosynthesis protein